LLNCHPGNNQYKIDTVWVRHLRVLRTDPSFGDWNVGAWQPGDSILPGVTDSGFEVESSFAYPTDFYTGAESTTGLKGARVRPRRVNPDRRFHAVSYVWRQGASSAPYGLGPPMGGSLFPRGAVAAASPLFSVARSEPFMPISTVAGYEYYFTPAWDVKLTPLDSIGVVEITSDTGYPAHTRNSFSNLEDLRKYVLLP
jgi:hypothetical protein